MRSREEALTESVSAASHQVRFIKRYALILAVLSLLAALLFLYFWNDLIISIGPGQAGVLWSRFGGGTVIDRYFDEGTELVRPWDKMYIYNIRNQQIADSVTVLSVNGLTIRLDLSIRYHPYVEMLGVLHREVGPDYVHVVVLPEIQSVVRTIIGQYKPEELYTAQKAIAEQIFSESSKQVEERYIILDDVLVKRIWLPVKIKEAIESKLQQQQLAQEYEFRLVRERKEVERKLIEAQGIVEFSRALNDKWLQYRGIEATRELAQSPNSKIVVIGPNKKDLPIMLGGN
jgi:regulator of protease activity HflC (stomatin/prohibitin superfamily)